MTISPIGGIGWPISCLQVASLQTQLESEFRTQLHGPFAGLVGFLLNLFVAWWPFTVGIFHASKSYGLLAELLSTLAQGCHDYIFSWTSAIALAWMTAQSTQKCRVFPDLRLQTNKGCWKRLTVIRFISRCCGEGPSWSFWMELMEPMTFARASSCWGRRNNLWCPTGLELAGHSKHRFQELAGCSHLPVK